MVEKWQKLTQFSLKTYDYLFFGIEAILNVTSFEIF